jgi:hypothetical protein
VNHRRGGTSFTPTLSSAELGGSSEALLRRSTTHVGSIEGGILIARTRDRGIQAVKAARNQALWRELNESIRLVAESSEHMEFLCECADLNCTETLHLTVSEYEHVRRSPVRFPIARGHDFPQVEHVVEEHDRYSVVQKKGVAADEAARLDPRSR